MKKRTEKMKIKKKSHSKLELYANIDWDKASKLFQSSPASDTGKHTYPPIKEILKILAGVGAIGLIFAFPGAAPAIGSLVLGNKTYGRWQTKQAIGQMAKRKLVSVENNSDGSVTVKITEDGMKRALTYQLESMEIKKPKKWDRKWRLVIFDIPEKYRRARDIFRMRLKQLGLYLLQESVYIHPYPCANEIEFLRELYGIPVKVRYLLVEKTEDNDELKEHFELS